MREICALTWAQVDRKLGLIRIEPGQTKNDEGRTTYLDGEQKEIFKQHWQQGRKLGIVLSYVVLNGKALIGLNALTKHGESLAKRRVLV